jgi:hypothetical protein
MGVNGGMDMGGIEKLKFPDLKTKAAGLLSDGGNLYLRSFEAKDGTLTRGWIFRFQLPAGRRRGRWPPVAGGASYAGRR